jgi:hypothetical protein
MANVAHAMSRARNRNHIPLIGQLRALDSNQPLKLRGPPLGSALVHVFIQNLAGASRIFQMNDSQRNDIAPLEHFGLDKELPCDSMPELRVLSFPAAGGLQ